MHSLKRYVSSAGLFFSREKFMLHNDNYIVTSSIVMYYFQLITSENMLIMIGSAIESSNQCIFTLSCTDWTVKLH